MCVQRGHMQSTYLLKSLIAHIRQSILLVQSNYRDSMVRSEMKKETCLL